MHSSSAHFPIGLPNRLLPTRELNQHGVHRGMHREEEKEGDDHAPPSSEAANKNGGGRHTPPKSVETRAKSFRIDDLPPAPDISQSWYFKGSDSKKKWESGEILNDDKQTFLALCSAVLELDLAAIKYMLYDVGVPADITSDVDANRNAFHCLGAIYLWGDASPSSLVFSHLKGQKSWATDLYDPPLAPEIDSVVSSDVLNSLDPQLKKVAQWLQRAGVPVHSVDTAGNTPLHFAAYGGALSMINVLIESGADVNVQNKDGNAPIHYALAQGQAQGASVLFSASANMELANGNRVKPVDLIVNPGPIYPQDAMKYFKMKQRPAKQIKRILHPELHPNVTDGTGWIHGAGGWNTHRLKGYDGDMECDIVDQYWADEITSEDIYYKYLARNAPVLIRGLVDKWSVTNRFKHENLLREHGNLKVQVSDIPYSVKFGGDGSVDMTLGEYISMVATHTIVGGSHPWYVFKGHRVPEASDKDKDSLVPIETCPTPTIIQEAFDKVSETDKRTADSVGTREIFVNAQWALGGEGTGAPVHYHNTAWNALIYGAKKWVVYPPRDKIMSNEQILQFTEKTQKDLCARGICAVTCTQMAGDVMIIPESYGHGVLNVQESVAIATEVKTPVWRMQPQVRAYNALGHDKEGGGGGGRGGGPGGRGGGRGGRGKPSYLRGREGKQAHGGGKHTGGKL